jgi:hypothetical protein
VSKTPRKKRTRKAYRYLPVYHPISVTRGRDGRWYAGFAAYVWRRGNTRAEAFAALAAAIYKRRQRAFKEM